MNWLAHLLLSKNDIEYQHGNLLADLLKGRSWGGASERFIDGLSMHRSIDAFTDRHPLVMTSKSRLRQGGRLKGVVIDITYDHLLACHWQHYAKTPLETFIETFHSRSREQLAGYPDVARAFLARLIESEHLMDYASIEGVATAFRRIDRRLSPRVLARERAVDYLPLVTDAMPGIEEDFLGFMPDLIGHFKSTANLRSDNHWLR